MISNCLTGKNDISAMAEFLDTNIWIYAHTEGVDNAKSEQARKLLRSVKVPVISSQVLGEYSAVMIRNRLPSPEVQANLDSMIAMCRTLPVSADTVQQAWEIRNRYAFSFWDSQLVAAALETGCDMLYTEDLQHDQRISSLRVVNPFL